MALFRLNVGHDSTWVFLWNQFAFSASLFRKCCSGKPDVFSPLPTRGHRGSSVSAVCQCFQRAGTSPLAQLTLQGVESVLRELVSCSAIFVSKVLLLVFYSGKSRADCIPEKKRGILRSKLLHSVYKMQELQHPAVLWQGIWFGCCFFLARKHCWCYFPKLLNYARVIPVPSFPSSKGGRTLWSLLHPVQTAGWGHQHETGLLPVPFHQSLQGEPGGALQERPGVHRGRKSFTLVTRTWLLLHKGCTGSCCWLFFNGVG